MEAKLTVRLKASIADNDDSYSVEASWIAPADTLAHEVDAMRIELLSKLLASLCRDVGLGIESGVQLVSERAIELACTATIDDEEGA